MSEWTKVDAFAKLLVIFTDFGIDVIADFWLQAEEWTFSVLYLMQVISCLGD